MWLATATDTPWVGLAEGIAMGLPVPEGFVVPPQTPEGEIRAVYEELKARTRIHFVAVRGPSHAVLNVIGPDALIHSVRRFWAESSDAAILIQRMVASVWCGKTRKEGRIIEANEGLVVFNPDTYVVQSGECVHQTIEPKQRKTIRYVDGTLRTVEREGERTHMTDEQLKKVVALALKAKADITWALDDQDIPWLISRNAG